MKRTKLLSSSDIGRVLHHPGADRTLSLYLRVDPAAEDNQSNTPGWRIWLKSALRGLAAANDDPALAGLRARAWRFAENLRPESKAIAAFFFSEPEAEQVFSLPVPIAASEIAFGRPAVAPLLWLLDEYEPHVVVRVDVEKARFFVARMGRAGAGESRRLDLDQFDLHRKTMHPTSLGEGGYVHGGSDVDTFAATVDDHVRRFHREVADRCGELLEETGARRIILGGDDAAAHAVAALMRPAVARTVVGVVPVPLAASDQAAADLLLPVALQAERDHERALVDEVIDLARSGGRGALGREPVLERLRRAQVELLIVPWPLRDAGLRAELPERALAAGAEIELVAGEAAEQLEREGGLAARLYYASE